MSKTTDPWTDVARLFHQNEQFALADVDIDRDREQSIKIALNELEELGMVRNLDGRGEVWEFTEAGEVLIGGKNTE